MGHVKAAFERYWLPLYLLLSVSWLFAPWLHQTYVGHLEAISSYEATGQPWGWLFRLCDVAAAVVLLLAVRAFSVIRKNKTIGWLLLAFGVLVALDGLFVIGCGSDGCSVYETFSRSVHIAETVASFGVALALLAVDASQRRSLSSSLFFAAIMLVGIGVTMDLVTDQQLVGLQYVYQIALSGWIVWLLHGFAPVRSLNNRLAHGVRMAAAGVAVLTAVLLLLQAFHMDRFIPFLQHEFLTYAHWLSGHDVVAAILLLYLARQIYYGQRRAGQLLLLVLVLQVLRYSIVTPQPVLLAVYMLLAVTIAQYMGAFDRNRLPSTLGLRLRSVAVVFAGIAAALLIAILVAAGSHAGQRFAQHLQGIFGRVEERRTERVHRGRAERAAGTVLVTATGAVVVWALFLPAAVGRGFAGRKEQELARKILEAHSTSSEDYFKLWPEDKNYLFSATQSGFIAYKCAGSVAFALADPVGATAVQKRLLKDFADWARTHGLSVCFIGVNQADKALYQGQGLQVLPIGSTAVIDVEQFVTKTLRSKWWRWQMNRAKRNGVRYEVHDAPHDAHLLRELRQVSDGWLTRAGHREQAFGLGYFDEAYLQDCRVHCLRDQDGQLLAFTNQLPSFHGSRQATVDLIRFSEAGTNGGMPVLISHLLQQLQSEGYYRTFDLGLVPLARLEGRLADITRKLLASRYSAAGLEQFKSKFEPDWQKVYLAYDGDVLTLGAIAANLEKVLDLP